MFFFTFELARQRILLPVTDLKYLHHSKPYPRLHILHIFHSARRLSVCIFVFGKVQPRISYRSINGSSVERNFTRNKQTQKVGLISTDTSIIRNYLMKGAAIVRTMVGILTKSSIIHGVNNGSNFFYRLEEGPIIWEVQWTVLIIFPWRPQLIWAFIKVVFENYEPSVLLKI